MMCETLPASAPKPPRRLTEDQLRAIAREIETLEHGRVEIVVQDGRPVRIHTTRQRLL